jgi:hypothetical protein
MLPHIAGPFHTLESTNRPEGRRDEGNDEQKRVAAIIALLAQYVK